MAEYLANGTPLGWLLVPEERRVYVYAAKAEPRCLENPQAIDAEPLLPGFVLDLQRLWEPGF